MSTQGKLISPSSNRQHLATTTGIKAMSTLSIRKSLPSPPPYYIPTRKQKKEHEAIWKSPTLTIPHFSMSKSSSISSNYDDHHRTLLASSRWNVIKADNEMSAEIDFIKNENMMEMSTLRKQTRRRMNLINKKLMYILRWSYPPLSDTHQSLVKQYAEYLMSISISTSSSELAEPPRFKFLSQLENWGERCKGTTVESTCIQVEGLLKQLRDLVLNRDTGVRDFSKHLDQVITTKAVKKEGQLKWIQEKNVGRKDRFYTLHYMATHNLIPALQKMLDTHCRIDPSRIDIDAFGENQSTLSADADADADAENSTNLPRPLPVTATATATKEMLPPNNNSTAELWDINERDPDYGFSPLIFACRAGHGHVVHLLLKYGADENLRIEDGRTPLHFAAAYGDKGSILALLTTGADFNAVDNYGCKPIDLAVQNQNKKTIDILTRWNNLLPPSPTSTPRKQEDLSLIPDEYLTTEPRILAHMSPTLRLLTKRIEGDGDAKHSFANNNSMDPWSEMRLCDKHAKLCFVESFWFEGIKSLRRKWRIAKQLCLKSYNDGERKIVDNGDGDLYNYSNTTEDDLSLIKSTFRNRNIMNGSSALEIGRDLAETLISLRAEGYALVIMEECLDEAVLPHLDASTRIDLLARYVEIGLCVHDLITAHASALATSYLYNLTHCREEEGRTRAVPPTREVLQPVAQGKRKDEFSSSLSPSSSPSLQQSLPLDQCLYLLESRSTDVLCECDERINQSLILHETVFGTSVALLEPITKAALLELMGCVKERQDDIASALSFTTHAHAVSSRVLGSADFESIRLGLQVLRLSMRLSLHTHTPAGFIDAAVLADELSLRVDDMGRARMQQAHAQSQSQSQSQLSRKGKSRMVNDEVNMLVSESEREEGTLLYTQMAELISLCRLLEQQERDRKDDTIGKDLVIHHNRLITSSSSSSSSSRSGNKWGKKGSISRSNHGDGVVSMGRLVHVSGMGDARMVMRKGKGKGKVNDKDGSSIATATKRGNERKNEGLGNIEKTVSMMHGEEGVDADADADAVGKHAARILSTPMHMHVSHSPSPSQTSISGDKNINILNKGKSRYHTYVHRQQVLDKKHKLSLDLPLPSPPLSNNGLPDYNEDDENGSSKYFASVDMRERVARNSNSNSSSSSSSSTIDDNSYKASYYITTNTNTNTNTNRNRNNNNTNEYDNDNDNDNDNGFEKAIVENEKVVWWV